MFGLNAIRTGFMLGISLVLAAIIYFFAANWSGLERIDKILLSAGLVLLFYGLSFALNRLKSMPSIHTFLSNVFLLGGCISFGAAVALLHQIYNSHADSYAIFLIWAVPALLLSWITRYTPLYILSYVLVHLSIWFYFFPSFLYVVYSEEQLLSIGLLFAVINMILFALAEMNRLNSIPLKGMSFILLHISLLFLTNSWEFETYGIWMNIAALGAIAFGFYYFIRIRLNRTFLTLNALAASAFAVFKFIELAIRHASILFFFYGLVFVALLLASNVWFFRSLNKLGADQGPATVEEEVLPREKSGDHRHLLVGKAVSAIVTVIGVIIGSISLIGIVLVVTDLNNPQYFLLFLGLAFIVPMVALPRLNPVVRYTLLTIGYITGIVSIIWIDKLLLTLLFIVLSIAGWLRLEGSKQRFFTYALFNFNIGIVLFQLFDALENLSHEFTYIILLLTILNTVLYSLHLMLPESPLRQHVRTGGLFFSLLFLFWLTFLGGIFPYSYELFNGIYFIAVTLLVFGFLRREQSFEAGLSLAFWFAFLVYKYYDIFWSLLHKSLTLALLGIIIIAVSYVVALRTTIIETRGEQKGLLRRSFVLIAIVILLQLGYLGLHVTRSEILLTTGSTVKLEIAPLDPRSMLQGDYVVLSYSISRPPEPIAKELEDYRGNHKVQVVLAPDDRGVHIFKRLYQNGESLSEGEVVLNGKSSGWGPIHYGIETYFVPEGTGLEVESKARFATIRVNAHGDALLESLAEN